MQAAKQPAAVAEATPAPGKAARVKPEPGSAAAASSAKRPPTTGELLTLWSLWTGKESQGYAVRLDSTELPGQPLAYLPFGKKRSEDKRVSVDCCELASSLLSKPLFCVDGLLLMYLI